MATSRFSEKGKGKLEKKLKALKKLDKQKKLFVAIGIPKGSGDHDPEKVKRKKKKNQSGTASTGGKEKVISLAEIAAINEFGSDDGRIPERSFLRATLAKNKKKYKKLIDNAVKKLIKNPKQKEQILGIVGEIVQDDVKEFMIDLSEPPNAPFTIEQKGADNPLIDSGQLVGSIRFVIGKE